MKLSTLIIGLYILLISCNNGENQSATDSDPYLVGGPCEGCEAVLEYDETSLNSVDTLPTFNRSGKKIKVSGTIYQQDGKTPAEGVILYVYHTNQEGVYETKGDEKGWGKRHGFIRSWLKTDSDGKYAFYTIKPGTYPSRSEPAHIHFIVLEPDGKYYWIEGCHFEGDSLLTKKEMSPKAPRGGKSGILKLEKEGDLWTGERDIILGKNIPNYD